MKRLSIFLIVCTTCLLSCRKTKIYPAPLPPLPLYAWTDYLGTYDVYDTANHTQWVMKIKHLKHSDFNQGNNDSILIENFANRFTIRDKWHPAYDFEIKKWGFRLYVYHPIIDQYSYNWHLSGGVASSGMYDNILHNDSVTLYFKQSNIAFYQADGVPYYECDCKHIAVKRH